jgi:hypothetical protein
MNNQSDYIEVPVVKVFDNSKPILVIYSHINEKCQMILTKEEAALLLIELHKFVNN